MSGSSVGRAATRGVLLLALLAPGPAVARPSDDEPDGPRGQLEALRRESQAASAALERCREAAEGDAEKEAAVDAYFKAMRGLAGRALAIVDEDPKDPAALDAVLWVIQEDWGGGLGLQADLPGKAYDLLARRWITSERLAPVCYYAAGGSIACPEVVHFLREAKEKSPYPLVRGVACLSLAEGDRRLAAAGQRMRDPVTRKPLADLFAANPRALEVLEASDPEALHREAEALLQRVIAEYPDLRMPHPYNPTPLGALARGELYRLRYLSVGRVAPEIEGEDMDGRRLKLGDYRGKVVALVFWATWCGPCMGMVPHERELVRRLEGKRFALLGVNGDDDRGAAKAAMARERMTWRSFWNGGKTRAIVEKWGVTSWPTVYILDANGVIRYENVLFGMMDRAVDRLIEEAEASESRAR